MRLDRIKQPGSMKSSGGRSARGSLPRRKRPKTAWPLLLVLCLAGLAGCTHRYAYTNSPLPPAVPAPSPDIPAPPRHASFTITDDRGNQDVLVLLALSGGGSRAAYLAGQVMLKLQQDRDMDVLKEVDAISSVSGGSLAGAYYAVSRDPEFTISVPRGTLDCGKFPAASKIACQADKKRLVIGKFASPAEAERERNTVWTALTGYPEKERGRIDRLLRLSQADVKSGRVWIGRDERRQRPASGDPVEDLLSRDYVGRWIANWFWPVNIGRYWFTAYDRSDLMAQTFEDNLFDTKPLGFALTFGDLNPERPYLIVNATDGTEAYATRGRPAPDDIHFGSGFTFTEEDFTQQLASDIYRYDVARGVMASAAFPAVFTYITLKDFTDPGDERYHHVFDGGNADNLGLKSLSRLIEKNPGRYKRYVVILVDAFIEPAGKDSRNPDPRQTISYIVDTNFMSSFDALLKNNRNNLIDSFLERHDDLGDKLTFWHLTFDKIDAGIPDIVPETGEEPPGGTLRNALNRIATDFRISDDDKARIEEAVRLLFTRDQSCLERIRTILASGNPDEISLAPEPASCRR